MKNDRNVVDTGTACASHPSRRRALHAIAAGVSTLAMGSSAWAQSADSRGRPLKIVVATAAGGVPDILARTIGQQITQATGRTVVVDNRLGAGGAVAASAIVNAPADGTSVVLCDSGAYSMVPHMSRINAFGNLAPVALAAVAPVFLCAHPSTGVKNVQDFIAYVKSHPGAAFGTSGVGSWHHIGMEMMKRRSGIDLTHVPYKGAGQTVVALIAGEVPFAFLGFTTAMPQAAEGKLRVIAIGSTTRSRLAPEIPTFADGGGPRSDMRMSALIVFAHTDTPASELDYLNRQFAAATASRSVEERLEKLGIESSDGKLGQREFAAFIREEYSYYERLIPPLNIRLDA